MRTPDSLLDATRTVAIGDAAAVADATDRILTACFGTDSFDRPLLHASFARLDRLFAGDDPDYLACDMPYHDLRHSLDVALVMARIIAGYRKAGGGSDESFTPDYGLLGVVLALLHDIGYLRKASEAALCGPQLGADHEARGVEFAQRYLRTTSLAEHARLAPLILATRIDFDLGALFSGCERRAVTLGQMLGSADLVSQIADRCYLERCYHHLYPELVLGGREGGFEGSEGAPPHYRDALDLVRKTPWFYENVVHKRMHQDFQQVSCHLAAHFGGADPYAEGIRDNLERCRRIVSEDRWDLLRHVPATTTRNLATVYGAAPSHPNGVN